ncbi:Pwp1p [Sugiyamaella lignohabitans]|uniref:Pwp1p n=1 Tax=Sugiyamaella lignohabitans TaxID=796027 RepID=A0A167ECF3_9ASCO|nr:Pwp1p [Sugiyamaella lignohabitans]ANB13903.1 Pwp1p [Sugiyamaella lignohabitans]
MISATSWVPRGFAAEFPVKYDLNDEEVERISHLAKLQLKDAQEALEEAEAEGADVNADADAEVTEAADENVDVAVKSEKKSVKFNASNEDGDAEVEEDDDLKEYDLENYDNDEDEGEGEKMGMFNGVQSLAYYEPGEKDPYITLPNAEDEDEEREELQILPSDNLILATKTEDDISYLEVYVYNENSESKNDEEDAIDEPTLYVHHDLMLPSFPLCVEWIGYQAGNKVQASGPDRVGNFAAIGTFEPEIEVWNLDVVDSAYPDLILGQRPDNANDHLSVGPSKKSKKKQKKINSKLRNDQYHVDAVLSLSANKLHRNLLASGSADTTVKLWDLNNGVCAKSFQFHDNKVSTVAFNPVEGSILLSGGYDATAIVSDLRVSGSEGQRKWKVDGDIEGGLWASNGNEFYISTEHGRIHKFDARQEGKSLWTLQAHDDGITSFDVNKFIDGYMVTASTDKSTKLWNLSPASGPSLILSRDLDIGKVFSVGFAPDKEAVGHVVAAGSQGIVRVWDTLSNRTVRGSFGKQVSTLRKESAKEVIVGVTEDDEEEDDDEAGADAAENGGDSDEEM